MTCDSCGKHTDKIYFTIETAECYCKKCRKKLDTVEHVEYTEITVNFMKGYQSALGLFEVDNEPPPLSQEVYEIYKKVLEKYPKVLDK